MNYNFYDLRATNPPIIEKGCGIYLKPTILNIFFGGKINIGTDVSSHKLTNQVGSNALKINGPNTDLKPFKVLTTNPDGVVSSSSLADKKHSFIIIYSDTILSEKIEFYIHKGGNITYLLPSVSEREGQIWEINNVGENTLILYEVFCSGNLSRNTIINKPKGNKFTFFSEVIHYSS